MALVEEDSLLPDILAGGWTRTSLEQLARDLGVIKRARKKDVWVLLWTLLLGFSVGQRRLLTALWENYSDYAEQRVSFSSFQNWFTPALARLIKHLVHHAIREQRQRIAIRGHLLDRFTELVAIDSSVFTLLRFLQHHYPYTNKSGAAAKLHVAINILDATVKSLKLTSQRVGDGTPWKRLGPWVRGRLLLIDLGYYDFNLFSRIDDNGGFFVSRVKSHANPRLVADNLPRGRGNRIQVVGQRLQDVLSRLQRDVFDVIVEVEVKQRKYRGRRRTVTRRLRLVGLRRPDGGYFLYFTNIPAIDIPADDLGAIYALRWQVEIDQTWCLHKDLGSGWIRNSGVCPPCAWAPPICA